MATRLILMCLMLVSSLICLGQVKHVSSPEENWKIEVEKLLEDQGNLNKPKWALQEAGFWLFEIRKDTLYTGPKMRIGELSISNADDLNLFDARTTLNDSLYRFHLSELLLKKANQGYPFASLILEDYEILNNELVAHLNLDKGPLIRLDSLVILGDSKINRSFIERELGWQSGRIYSKKYLESLVPVLKRLEFLQNERAPAVAFFPGSAHVYLYLKKRGANLINGVVGLNTDDNGNSTLTGDFQLRLLNTFKRGEEISFRWRNPGNQSQDLNLGFHYPYLFGSPIGLGLDLEIFRQDSSFVRRDFKLSLPYRLAQGSHFNVSGQFFSTNPLGVETNSQFQVAEIQTLRFNLGFDVDRRDDAIVSKDGYRLDFELGSGQRTSPEGTEVQYLWRGNWSYFLPYKRRWVWHQSYSTAGMSGTDLQDNEIFRLGGINDLRGFNEWSFFTPAYGLMRSEIRYMLGAYDYLSIFGDLAFTERDRSTESVWDRHSGLGLGVNFQTKGGIFSLFLAVGQTNRAQYDLRSSKIHLAYVNRF